MSADRWTRSHPACPGNARTPVQEPSRATRQAQSLTLQASSSAGSARGSGTARGSPVSGGRADSPAPEPPTAALSHYFVRRSGRRQTRSRRCPVLHGRMRSCHGARARRLVPARRHPMSSHGTVPGSARGPAETAPARGRLRAGTPQQHPGPATAPGASPTPVGSPPRMARPGTAAAPVPGPGRRRTPCGSPRPAAPGSPPPGRSRNPPGGRFRAAVEHPRGLPGGAQRDVLARVRHADRHPEERRRDLTYRRARRARRR